MTRRNRQGWRELIVLMRLAIVGLISITGPPLIPEPGTVFAQTEPDRPAQPPPPPVLQPHHPSNPEPAESPPAPAPTPITDFGSPPLISLPIPPSLERLTARRNSLNQILYRDRRHQLLLTRGDDALSGGDSQAALANFQALVDATHDAFFWPEDSLDPQGAQASVSARLQSLSIAQRESYERRHGDAAHALLSEAIETGDERLTLELLRRYPHTAAGRKAMVRELLFAFDTGCLSHAAELANRLSADPYHWQRLAPAHKTLISRVESLARTGHRSALVLSANPASISPPALQPIWTIAFQDGLAGAAEATTGESPLVNLDATVNNAVCEWRDERRERRFPVSTANQPVVVGDWLITRDFAGIRAIRLNDGRQQWAFACLGSLTAKAADNLREQARGGGAPPLNYHTHFAGHGLRGRLTTDGRRVFFIDDNPPAHSPVSDHSDHHEPTIPPTNRLIALPLAPQVTDPNNPLKNVIQRATAVSAVRETKTFPDVGTADTAVEHGFQRTAKPLWIRGQRKHGRSEPLDGQFFLGPPLPVDGRLFVLAEIDGRIECCSLDAEDGKLLWQQPISLTQQPIGWDTGRLRMACTPLYAESVVICPTEVGVIVGVDSLTGVLRWVYDHIDDDQRLAAGRWSSSTQRNFGSAELPSRTLLHDGRLYHLPFRSRFVHCIDASTGRLLWKTERGGALALSAVTSEAVVLIGPRDTIALSPADGSRKWKTGCPEPAGHGLVAGGHYLLPTVDGRCLSLSLTDGTLRGSRFGKLLHELSRPPSTESQTPQRIQLVSFEQPAAPQPAATPATQPLGESLLAGNLLATGDVIVITTPTHVAVVPQAQALLERLAARSMNDGEQLQAAMLHLLLDQRDAAKRDLQSLTATPSSPNVMRRARQMLREVLFAELAESPDPLPLLEQLAALPGNQTDRLRLLVSRIDAGLARCDAHRLSQALDEFRSIDAHNMIGPGSDDNFTVSAIDYVADQFARHHSRRAADELLPATGIAASLDDYVTRAVAQAATSGDIAERERVVTLFDDWPQVADLRNDVADACVAAGRLQQAELLLLKTCGSHLTPQTAAARAHRLLTDIYATQGLHSEAAAHLLELGSTFGDIDTGDGLTGHDVLDRFPHEHPAWNIVRRRRATPQQAYHVQISEHLCDEACASAVTCRSTIALQHHDRIRRKFLIGHRSSVMVIDRGIVTPDRTQSRLTLINRETGQLHGEIVIPAAYWQLAGSGDACCGQLLPVCGRTAHGLSLLEKRPVWSTGQSGGPQTHDKVKVGPIGHDYCVLQTTRQLSVIHPATGELKWSRDDLPPGVGLLANEATGIIGDRETLTLFDADGLTYTVYRMRSGREVRTGRLPIAPEDARRYRRASGANLIHIVTDDDGERLRIWKAANDRLLLDEPLHDGLFCSLSGGPEYAFVSADHQLTIIEVTSGKRQLELALTDATLDDIDGITVTSDPEHYFVNLIGCFADSAEETVAATDEVEVPSLHVRGQLLAVSRQGHLLWSQSVADAALLTQPDCCLPVLTLVSRVRDPLHRQSQTLRIDVRDARSGQLLARRDDLLRTRIVQSIYHQRPGRLTLVGLDSQIDIDFGPSRPDLLIHADADPPLLTR